MGKSNFSAKWNLATGTELECGNESLLDDSISNYTASQPAPRTAPKKKHMPVVSRGEYIGATYDNPIFTNATGKPAIGIATVIPRFDKGTRIDYVHAGRKKNDNRAGAGEKKIVGSANYYATESYSGVDKAGKKYSFTMLDFGDGYWANAKYFNINPISHSGNQSSSFATVRPVRDDSHIFTNAEGVSNEKDMCAKKGGHWGTDKGGDFGCHGVKKPAVKGWGLQQNPNLPNNPVTVNSGTIRNPIKFHSTFSNMINDNLLDSDVNENLLNANGQKTRELRIANGTSNRPSSYVALSSFSTFSTDKNPISSGTTVRNPIKKKDFSNMTNDNLLDSDVNENLLNASGATFQHPSSYEAMNEFSNFNFKEWWGKNFKKKSTTVSTSSTESDAHTVTDDEANRAKDEIVKAYKKSGTKKKITDWIKSDEAKNTLDSISTLVGKIKGTSAGDEVLGADVNGGGSNSGEGTTILGMHPVTFGVVVLGSLLLVVGGVMAYKHFKK